MQTNRTVKLLSLGLAVALLTSLAGGCAPAASEPTAVPESTPLPTAETGPETESVRVTGPQEARDAALAYLAEVAPGKAVPAGLAWSEESITPEGIVGAEGRRYTAGDWTVTVTYPVTSLEQVLYVVEVANQATGLLWEADVDAYGDVIEFAPADEEAMPEGTPSAGTAAVAELVSGNTAFALALYQALRTEAGNLFFSPYSISAALAMTYAGARGETETQMAGALHFDLPQTQLHPSFQALAAELATRGQGAAASDGEGFRLTIVNALWGQEGYDFLRNYLDLLSAYYGAGMERVDYSQPEKARAQINDWVSRQTEERIEDLIPEGGVNELTRLVLTNAIYFNAAWAAQFDEALTADGPFTRLDGSQVTVPMMSQTESFPYAVGDGYLAVELPYDGDEMSMVILLPDEGRLDELEGRLDRAALGTMLAGLERRKVNLTMPRFEFDAQFSLRGALSAMGMPIAFTADADLTGMAAVRELFISEVFHKAFVKVDENGTEAAAATAVVVGLTAFDPEEPIEVKIDRPFLFLIRDGKTGAILFLGRVVDPTG